MSTVPGRELPKEIRTIAERLVSQQGWRYERGNCGAHPVLFAPDGKSMVRISLTSSDYRATRNMIAQIRRAGGKV
jgi:hypothetical protein